MADPELEEIRRQRLAQLQSQYKDGESNPRGQTANEEQLKAQEDTKNAILTQILDQAARARCNEHSYVRKTRKGKMIENMLLTMAQTGQICTKIGEKELIGLLENVSNQTRSKATVKFDRRRAALDSDEDF